MYLSNVLLTGNSAAASKLYRAGFCGFLRIRRLLRADFPLCEKVPEEKWKRTAFLASANQSPSFQGFMSAAPYVCEASFALGTRLAGLGSDGLPRSNTLPPGVNRHGLVPDQFCGLNDGYQQEIVGHRGSGQIRLYRGIIRFDSKHLWAEG